VNGACHQAIDQRMREVLFECSRDFAMREGFRRFLGQVTGFRV
jgi:hypothetical protein